MAGRDAGRHLDHDDVAVIAGEQLRECDPVPQSERAHCGECDRFGRRERCARKLGGVEVDPADAEAPPGWPQAVGEGDELRIAAANYDDGV